MSCWEVRDMCRKINKKGCEHPEKLKGRPEECSPEQIKECHGDISAKDHPCASKRNRKK
jgi:transposase